MVFLTFHSLDMRVCNCWDILFIQEHQNNSTFMRNICWCPCLNTLLQKAPRRNYARHSAVWNTGTQFQHFYRSSAQGQDQAVLTITTTITPSLPSSCLNSRADGLSWCHVLSYIYNETHKYPILRWRRKQQLCAGCLPIQLI